MLAIRYSSGHIEIVLNIGGTRCSNGTKTSVPNTEISILLEVLIMEVSLIVATQLNLLGIFEGFILVSAEVSDGRRVAWLGSKGGEEQTI